MRKRYFKIASYLFILLFFISSLIGCGSKSESRGNSLNQSQNQVAQSKSSDQNNSGTGSASNGSNTEKAKADTAAPTNLEDQKLQNAQRKIIFSSTLDVETLNFDQALSSIQNKVQKVGGYIESSNIAGKKISDSETIQDRSAKFILRIPKDNLDPFTKEVGNLGNVINQVTSGQDVTNQYFDTEAHLKALKIQEERLLALLQKSGELKDIIELEKELANVRYQIETLTGTLKKWDNLVDYSTLTLNLYEVQQIEKSKKAPLTLGDKIVEGFKNSVSTLLSIGKGFLVVIATILPYTLLLVLLFFIYYFTFRRNRSVASFMEKLKRKFEKK